MCAVNTTRTKAVLITQMIDDRDSYELLFYGLTKAESESLGKMNSLKNLTDEQAYQAASNIAERYRFDLVWNCPKPSWATKTFNSKTSHLQNKRVCSNQRTLASAF